MCQFFVVLYNTREFYLKIRLRLYGWRQFGKKKNNEKAAIESQKRASQTGNCGSVLVRDVNEGTLELKKKKDTGNYLSIKYCKLFASVALWRTLWMLRANFRRT